MYKTASRYFQRFREATGKVAFNLRMPVRQGAGKGAKTQSHESNLTFSKWLRLFLVKASAAKDEIILITPAVKLSLARPLLLSLRGGGISLTIVTTVDRTAFRAASDLEALELLQRRPGLAGHTEIYRLQRPHPSVYIFDRKAVLLGPSVYTLPGIKGVFNKRLIDSPSVVRAVIAESENHIRRDRAVTGEELGKIRQALQSTPEISLIGTEYATRHRVDYISPGPDTSDGDEFILVHLPEDAEERDSAMSEFVERLRDKNLNSLQGVQFESSSVAPSDRNDWRVAAERDLERIRSAVV